MPTLRFPRGEWRECVAINDQCSARFLSQCAEECWAVETGGNTSLGCCSWPAEQQGPLAASETSWEASRGHFPPTVSSFSIGSCCLACFVFACGFWSVWFCSALFWSTVTLSNWILDLLEDTVGDLGQDCRVLQLCTYRWRVEARKSKKLTSSAGVVGKRPFLITGALHQ